jgi:anthranilate phosphoribosyltransferase
MKKILSHLFEHKYFDQEESYDILVRITAGEFNPAQMVAFMTAFSMRSIRVEELEGFRKAMYDQCLKIKLESDLPQIDLCGTGGDGKNTFNISTLASFVVAGAGYPVAKHGNYGVSSGCGSSNVMEFLGYQFINQTDVLQKQMDKANICFLHAPLFHPAMKAIAPIRRELGIKTFFNMLGPLTNPADPFYQSVGVFSLEMARLYGYLLQRSQKQYTIVHALDGYDEISLTGSFKTISRQGENIRTLQSIGFPTLHADQIQGGDTVEEAARIFIDVLENRGTEAQQQVVLINAAVAIQTIKPDASLADCYYEAEESVISRKALKCFKTLLQTTTHKNPA